MTNSTWVAPVAATANDVKGVLGIFQTVFEFLIDGIGKIVSVVMANPLLLIPIAVICTYTIIRVFKSLF